MSADYEVFRAAEEDESVIGSIVSAQREELERADRRIAGRGRTGDRGSERTRGRGIVLKR